MSSDELPREFMVAILPPVRKTLLQPCSQFPPLATLALRQTLGCRFQFTGMGDFLATRQREQMQEAGVYASLGLAKRRDRLGSGIEKQTQIPARSSLDQPRPLNPPRGQRLLVETDAAYSWDRDGVAPRGFQGIGKRNTGELVPLSLELGTLCQLLAPAEPCGIGSRERALQGMTGDTQLRAMASQQIVQGIRGVVDPVARIEIQLAKSPVPHTCEVPQPVRQLVFLLGGQTQLELPLDHATPVSGSRCTA